MKTQTDLERLHDYLESRLKGVRLWLLKQKEHDDLE